jgi:hypothetical protein
MMRKLKAVPILFAAAIATVTSATGRAGLTIDLRATGGSGGVGVVNEKLVDVSEAQPGDVVTFDVYALVTGNNANPNDEGFCNAFGSMLTSGTVRGHLSAFMHPEYRVSGFSNGMMQDLDGDGDLDVGSNNNSSASNFFNARGNCNPVPAPIPIHRLATVTMTLTDVPSGSFSTTVHFRPRVATSAGSWFEDGSATGTAQQGPSAIQVGAPVILTDVPEPGALGLLGASLAGLLARRGARRRA